MIHHLRKFKIISEPRLLELYPPFMFMGVKVTSVSSDYKELTVHVPLRWYVKNMHGSMFGGFLCAVTDPLAPLMCEKIIPDIDVWTKKHSVEFTRPARSTIKIDVKITDDDIQKIKDMLNEVGTALYTFKYPIMDERGHVVAEVENSVYMRHKDFRKKRQK